MARSKFIAIAAAAALAAMLGLSACGGQAASSSAASSAASSGSAAASSAAASSAAASSAAASSAAGGNIFAAAEKTLVSWQGALVDGTLVDFISSNDGKNGGFVLTKKDGADSKRWLGAMTADGNGTVTITDDNTKESVSFKLTNVTKEGAVLIDVEGYGKGAVVPMTAADWARVAEAEALAEALGTVTNTVGVFEDGSLIIYTENEKGTKAAVGIVPKNSKEMKTWVGDATTAENGKETITDDKSKETFNYTWTENAADGTVTIEADGYGKGVLVKMNVADWLILDQLAKSSSTTNK